MDPQKGFDLLADGARDLLAAGARIIVQGSGHAALADPFRALAAADPGRVALIERFDRDDGPPDLRGRGRVPHALPVRALRAGPDDRAALRHAADRAPDRRPRRLGHRRGRAPGGRGPGFVFDDATPAALVEAVGRAAALRRKPRAWARSVDRGMAVDFRWDTGSAPKYLEAYRRAIAIRRGG